MDLITDATAAASDPGVPSLAGTRGWFTGGTPGVTAATRVRYWWLNLVMNELVNLIAGTGISPSPTTNTQLFQAIKRMAGGNAALLTSGTTTLTVDNAGFVTIDASLGNVTVNLPAANANNGLPYALTFNRYDGTTNSVSIVCAGSDVIAPGSFTSLSVGAQESFRFDSNGSGWSLGVLRRNRVKVVYSSVGTTSFTVPAGVRQVYATCIGGGAGGGGATSSGAGGGGGAGARSEGWIAVAPGSSQTVVVGGGGTGGSAGNNNGTSGSASSFAGTISGGGGAYGTAGNSGAGTYGVGGTASGGTLNLPGQPGYNGVQFSSTWTGGMGGGAPGFSGPTQISQTAGGTGVTYGGGGGGGANNNAGGNGAQGIVIVEY